jgi:hypothetical protein
MPLFAKDKALTYQGNSYNFTSTGLFYRIGGMVQVRGRIYSAPELLY